MTVKRACWILAVVLAAPTAAAQTLTTGPILGKVTEESVTVRFAIDRAAAVEVRYGPTDAYGGTVAAGSGTAFEVEIGGLGPGETVHYRPVADGAPLGEDRVFRTAPPPRAPFRMLVYGDTRSGHDAHRGIVAAAAAHRPWVAAHTGDLVSDGAMPGDWVTFFAIETPLLAEAPLFAVAGNHEDTDESRLYVEHLPLPVNSPAPELYYSFDYGNVHGIVLDQYVNIDAEWLCLTRLGSWETCLNRAQLDWLSRDLAAAAADPDIDHVFVFVHEGAYSSKEGRDGSRQIRALLDTFRDHGVRVVFSGHDHYYERGFAGNGLPYVVTGGGGAPLYDPCCPTAALHVIAVSEAVYHYVILDVNGLDVTLTAYRLDGSVLDIWSYAAPPRPCADPWADCGTLPPDCAAGRWECADGACLAVDCAAGPDGDADGDEDASVGPDGDADEEGGAEADDLGPPADARSDIIDSQCSMPACSEDCRARGYAGGECDGRDDYETCVCSGGGCGCSTAGRTGGGAVAAVLLLLALVARRVRSASSRASQPHGSRSARERQPVGTAGGRRTARLS